MSTLSIIGVQKLAEHRARVKVISLQTKLMADFSFKDFKRVIPILTHEKNFKPNLVIFVCLFCGVGALREAHGVSNRGLFVSSRFLPLRVWSFDNCCLMVICYIIDNYETIAYF